MSKLFLRSRLLSVMVVVALAATVSWADAVTQVTTQASLSPDSSIAWSQLGGDQTRVSDSFTVTSNKGLNTSVNLIFPNSVVSVVCAAAPPSSKNCSWNSTGFTAGDSLLWTVNGYTGGNGPMMLTFASGVFGAGALIQSDVPGQFTASLQAFNGNTSLGTFTVTSNSTGDAVYLGALDATGPNITAVAFSITSCAGMCADFAVDSVDLATSVSVPNVVGDTQAAATSAITGAGLVVGTVTTQSSDTVPSGDVISQDPVAATLVAVGSAVNLVISSGQAQVAVPNVVGDTQAAATTAITGAGLVVGTVTTQNSTTVPSGDVISQSPTGGTQVEVGSAVNLVISSGPSQVAVPNVVGDTQAAATSAITGAGLVVGTVTTQSSSSVPSGSVISQSPAGGTLVNPGSAVNLVISSGPAQVQVPNVVGDTQAVATTAITSAGLVVGTVTTQSSSTVPAGSVISQSPTGGTLVNAGSAVNLVISSGATQVIGLSTGALNFGEVNLGSSESLKLTVSNISSSSFKITNIGFSYGPGAGKDFGYTTQCGGTLKPGNHCTITVTLKAQDLGAANASLNILYNMPGSPAIVALTGAVINPKAKLSKSSLSFGNVKVGQSSTQSVVLTSSGTSPLTINSITVSGSSVFTSSTCTSPLNPNTTCTINVMFAPTAKKSYSGTLKISDNASSSPQTVALSGKGD